MSLEVREPGDTEQRPYGQSANAVVLEVVLEAYAPTVPGWFLYFPSRAQRSTPLRLFAEVAKKVLLDRT